MIHPVISYTLDSRLMEGNTYLERSAPGIYLDSGATEGASCLEPLEQSVLVSSLAARPVEGITKKVSDWEPVINPVQDSTPDGQPMEETTYLEHSALGMCLDSGLMQGMSRTEPLEQSVLGAWAVVRLEETDTPERPALASRTYHKQACFTLTARPILDPAIAIDTDVNADINTDLPENSAPMMNTDSRLLKRYTQGCRPMKGITETRQVELSGLVLAIDRTNEEHLPPSNSWKQSDPIITEGQDYWESTEGTQFGYDTGYSSPELEDAIRREVLRNRSMGYMSSREVNGPLLLPEQVNLSDAENSLDQVRLEGLRQWNMDMDIEYQYETFIGLPVYYGGDMYDSEDTEEFVPNAPDGMECMSYTQRLPDDGDNRSVNTVNMGPTCRTVSRVARCEPDESSDTSRTDTAELEQLDSADYDLGTVVWEDMDCPVLIAGSFVDNSLCNSSQAMSNYRDVASMGDFADEDFIDTGFDSDMGSGAEFDSHACAWESWSAYENSPPDSARALPAVSVKDVVYSTNHVYLHRFSRLRFCVCV